VVLLDANFGRGATNAAEGFHWLAEILKRDPEAVVVMITAHGGVQIAVEAMKRGATDFVSSLGPMSAFLRLSALPRRCAIRGKGRHDRALAGRGRNRARLGGATPRLGHSPSIARVLFPDRAGGADRGIGLSLLG
jgi:DNA-binding NtrC family response regulator